VRSEVWAHRAVPFAFLFEHVFGDLAVGFVSGSADDQAELEDELGEQHGGRVE
jgi:hypothetical protein